MIKKSLFIHEKLVWLYMRFYLLMAIILPDKVYLKWRYKKAMGRKLNLDNPVLFQEKLQWLKLNDHKPVYHQMADKQDAKQFIASKVGEEYIIPTIGLYNSVNEIDLSKLPEQFVLKGTFDSGSYYICRDKSQINIKEMRKRLTTNWNINYYHFSKEWPYKGLKHRIIAEPLLADPSTIDLKEFKFFCFNGKPKLYQTCIDRDREKGGAILRFYNIEGKELDMQDGPHNRKSDLTITPINLELMLKMCETFAKETQFLRVDFFEVGNKLYVGEMTFYENGGFCWFLPEHWNKDMGDWIVLPIDN